MVAKLKAIKQSFDAGSMIAPAKSVHGFGRSSPATTNTMLFRGISICCAPSGSA
jgi:hypothetical protein